MVHRPPGLSAFEFVVLASLRAVQLSRGCTPRVEGAHKRIVIAQLEVASGLVARSLINDEAGREPI
jgi:DNA-directed RNA polymerase subunit K/omega